MRRGAEYEETKERYAQAMLDYADKRFPGLKELVDHREMSTPLNGQKLYRTLGRWNLRQSCDANRLLRDQWRDQDISQRALLDRSDVGTPGVNGAMMAGVMTAQNSLPLRPAANLHEVP